MFPSRRRAASPAVAHRRGAWLGIPPLSERPVAVRTTRAARCLAAGSPGSRPTAITPAKFARIAPWPLLLPCPAVLHARTPSPCRPAPYRDYTRNTAHYLGGAMGHRALPQRDTAMERATGAGEGGRRRRGRRGGFAPASRGRAPCRHGFRVCDPVETLPCLHLRSRAGGGARHIELLDVT